MKHFGSNSKTKLLEIKIKSLRDKFKKKEIDVKLIPSSKMTYNALTKAAPHASIKKLQQKCFSVFCSSANGGC